MQGGRGFVKGSHMAYSLASNVKSFAFKLLLLLSDSSHCDYSPSLSIVDEFNFSLYDCYSYLIKVAV